MSEEDAVQEAIRLSLQENTKPEEKKQKTEMDEESFEDLYDDEPAKTEEPKKEVEKPKVVECKIDPEYLAAVENTN